MSEVQKTALGDTASESFAAFMLRWRARSLESPSLLAALGKTPRSFFVAPEDAQTAYHNRTMPIECGEYIERIDEQIAIINALKLEKQHRILEIGTGSGFTAALMAHLVARVTTIERYKSLINRAQPRFQALNLETIILHHGDAYHGLPMHYGAFDRIIIWPSWETIPQIFMDRLAGGGLLIVPIGAADQRQMLHGISKIGSRLSIQTLFPVRYQPMLNGLPQTL